MLLQQKVNIHLRRLQETSPGKTTNDAIGDDYDVC